MASWQSHVIKFVLRFLQSYGPKPSSIQQERAALEARVAHVPKKRLVRYEPCKIEGMCAEWITAPGAVEERVILYLHGGAFIVGSVNTHRSLAVDLSRVAHARVLLVDYRLAPEYPFPAAIDDALCAYCWLLAQGIAPEHVAIAGDSAGGGLTVALLLAARDAGKPMPAAAVCLSPFIDLTLTGESIKTRAKVDVMVQTELMPFAIEAYLGETDPSTPLASPLYADLHGLPPLLIQVGTDEVLHDDATRLAANARAAGVDTTLEIWDGMFHSWQAWGWLLPEAQRAVARIGDFVRMHLSS
ncbi:MAG TPA: alpha/beta hydrolase [Ktedonobacteraceae bacterium]|nr:alpha/beta hydrolase [Ktedonobacteraceae bacterium]